MNSLKLANESFEVTECTIWGYLGKRNENWYCRWCVSVDCAERTIQLGEGEESLIHEFTPSMECNTRPIDIHHWHDLEGVTIRSGSDVEFEYLDPKDSRTIYSVFAFEHSKCLNNVIEISNRDGKCFRLRWSGEAYIFGTNNGNNEAFSLDATATFTGISLGSEVSDEAEIESAEISRIFSLVYFLDDFEQQPVQIRSYRDGDRKHVSFHAMFTPR